MTPEAAAHLAKARQFLAKARTMLGVQLTDEAGRAAYLAAFHAAQAFVFERTNRSSKTHAGTQSLFAKLAMKEPTIDLSLRQFLSQAYDLKTVADYEIGQVVVPLKRANWAIELAERFVDCLEGLVRQE